MGKVFERIYQEVKKIPKGKTATYKEIAKKAKTSPRIVGFALHCNPDPQNIPCHRVVFSDGSCSCGYAFGGREVQEKKLLEEANVTSCFDESSLFENASLVGEMQQDTPRPLKKRG